MAGNADELCGGELPTPQTKNDAYEMWSKICLLIIFFQIVCLPVMAYTYGTKWLHFHSLGISQTSEFSV